jgi:hypothetical protein
MHRLLFEEQFAWRAQFDPMENAIPAGSRGAKAFTKAGPAGSTYCISKIA